MDHSRLRNNVVLSLTLFFAFRLVEAESSFRNEGGPNPFPLWKSMMAFLVSEAFGYSKEKSIEERKIMEDRYGAELYFGKICN